MAQKPPSTFSRRILFWRMRHLLLRFLCLHEAAILALLVAILLTRFRSIFPGLLSICTLATAVAELFSSQWSAMEYHRCQPPCARSMRATTRTVSVSRVWVFCKHARRFMGCHFVKTSDSKPSALGLRLLKGSHPCFIVAHRRPPRPSMNLRPGQAGMATKHTACALGRSMAGLVAAEHHLCLNLTEIREKEKVFLLDAPISQTGLFGEAVSSVVEKFLSAKSQSAALKQFMPRRMSDPSNTPSNSRERSLPRKEPTSRSCALALPPPDYGLGSPRPAFSPPTTPHMGGSELARQAFHFSSSESSLIFRMREPLQVLFYSMVVDYLPTIYRAVNLYHKPNK